MGEVDVMSLIGPGPLDGRVALVTGSSSGIGAAIAGRVAERGATVVIDSASVGDPEEAERLVATTLERHGHLDILINATGGAASPAPGDAGVATTGDWEPVLRATVVGAWNVVRAAAPHLRASGGGVILNVSSPAVSPPAGSSIAHAVCEAALSHLTTLLAKALGPEIRVCAAAVADTDMGRLVGVIADSRPADQPDVAMTPLARRATHDIEECLADASPAEASVSMAPCHGRRRARQSHGRRKNEPRFGWESLTTAERRVAEAVGAGLTNTQAAQRLFVSPYTVDYHLRQIFLKLGISSRVQLALLVMRN